MDSATLILMCGLPCAGKTTRAKQLELERCAIRLTPDEWMEPLYGQDRARIDAARYPVEAICWSVAARALQLGVNAILDFGLLGRSERDDYRARAAALGARVEVVYLEVPKDELLRRLKVRNRELPHGALYVGEELIRRYWESFDRPLPDELDGSVVLVSSPEPERLTGGNTHASIVRIDNTVRRPTGPWTAGVHALLSHLEAAGFEGAPLVLGIDDEAREILTFVEGTVIWPGHFDLIDNDAALADIASLIRRYHQAAKDFDPKPYEWNTLAPDPSGEYEVMCHNDLAAWNLVRGSLGWTFIDWDAAAPGRRAWDLGWALTSFVPLFANLDPDPATVRRRLEVFAHGYGASEIPSDVIQVARDRAAACATGLSERASRGEEVALRLIDEGHLEVWTTTAEHIEAHLAEWTHVIQSPR